MSDSTLFDNLNDRFPAGHAPREYDVEGMRAAFKGAQDGLAEDGIPIGAAFLNEAGKERGRGQNRRVQWKSPILHAEMDCLEAVGRRDSYADCTIYTTLMPGYLAAGAIVQFRIPRVIVGESRNYSGAREFMESHGVEVVDLDLPECHELLAGFIAEHPDLWNANISA